MRVPRADTPDLGNSASPWMSHLLLSPAHLLPVGACALPDYAKAQVGEPGIFAYTGTLELFGRLPSKTMYGRARRGAIVAQRVARPLARRSHRRIARSGERQVVP